MNILKWYVWAPVCVRPSFTGGIAVQLKNVASDFTLHSIFRNFKVSYCTEVPSTISYLTNLRNSGTTSRDFCSATSGKETIAFHNRYRKLAWSALFFCCEPSEAELCLSNISSRLLPASSPFLTSACLLPFVSISSFRAFSKIKKKNDLFILWSTFVVTAGKITKPSQKLALLSTRPLPLDKVLF